MVSRCAHVLEVRYNETALVCIYLIPWWDDETDHGRAIASRLLERLYELLDLPHLDLSVPCIVWPSFRTHRSSALWPCSGTGKLLRFEPGACLYLLLT